MDNPNLSARVAAAIDRMVSTLQLQAPFLGREVVRWIEAISPDRDPGGHLTHLRMFPVLQLPEWIVQTLSIPPDAPFQQSLMDSSVNGYYYIRLIDDVTDGDRRRDLALGILPAAGYFCSQFQLPYQECFPPHHKFWSVFTHLWAASCESAAHDAQLSSVSWPDFERISSRKYSAAGIPSAAACFHYGRPDLIDAWLQFTDDLARWSQMLDDTIDWHSDRSGGRATYFISEGERRKRAGESLDQWVAREGFVWAFSLLEKWLENLHRQAACLGSRGLQTYLAEREVWFRQQKSTLLQGFAEISRLAAILNEASVEA